MKLIKTVLIIMFVLLSTFSCTSKSSTVTIQPESSSSPVSTVAPKTTESKTVTANWWDQFGEPRYGGTLNFSTFSLDNLSWDPDQFTGADWQSMYLDPLFYFNWTLDRKTWAFVTDYTPPEYYSGIVAEKWEWPDPNTWVVHLRKGVYWQKKSPVNGRELTADDVKYSYDRALGTGSGFTVPNPFSSRDLEEVTGIEVIDKYTVAFKISKKNARTQENLLTSMIKLVPHEWVEQGDTLNWRNAVGNGPYMVKDFSASNTLTFIKNPDYWGYDERHPANKLPYIDEVKVIAIQDKSTLVAAVRSGRIDMITIPRGQGITWQQAQSLNKTNPELKQAWWPVGGPCVDMRCDTKPFDDIRVRKALQMAVDRETIAKTHYGGTVDPTPCAILSPMFAEYAYVYDKWSLKLKEEYGYHPEISKQLLKEAGYPTGFKTNIVASSADDSELLQIIKSYFKEIGVDMEIRVIDESTFMNFIWANKHDQMCYATRTGMTFSPYACFDLRMSANPFNQTENNDPVYENMVNAMMEKENPPVEEVQAIDKYILEHHWSIHLFGIKDPVFWQPYVKGYSGELVQNAPGVYFARWWLSK